MRAVEQHVAARHVDELQAAGPDAPSRSRAAVPPASAVGSPACAQRIEQRLGDRRVRGLVPPAKPDAHGPEARQVDEQPVAIDRRGSAARPTSASGAPTSRGAARG